MQAQREASKAAEVGGQAETVGDALTPVLSWEKSDVEFWVQIAQLVVLVMILRELQR